MDTNDGSYPELTPEQFQALNRLIGGYRVSRAIAVVVGLGIVRFVLIVGAFRDAFVG